MTAEEIRNVNEIYLTALQKLESPAVNVVNGVFYGTAVLALLEIAAQLAEIKDILRASAPGNRME